MEGRYICCAYPRIVLWLVLLYARSSCQSMVKLAVAIAKGEPEPKTRDPCVKRRK